MFSLFTSLNNLITKTNKKFKQLKKEIGFFKCLFSPRVMLGVAWVCALVCSLPQSFIYRLKTHPILEDYRSQGEEVKQYIKINSKTMTNSNYCEPFRQCTTIGYFEETFNDGTLVSFGFSKYLTFYRCGLY